AAVGVLTVAATIAGGGRPVFAMAPALVAAVGYLLAKLPLRYSATALLFLLLALEVSGDALDLWSTPLVRLGDLLTDCSGAKTGLKVSGSEAILAFLIGVMFYRRATGSSIDGAPRPMATIVRDSLVIYLLGFVYMEALGAVHGLDTATWKARYLLHVLAFFFVFQAAYRSAEDARPVAAAVVVAAHIKALLAAWVQTVVAPAMTGGELAFATNHGDSVLFVMSIVLVLTAAMEKPDQRNVLRAALLIPLPLWALVLNQRRTAWAMLGAAVAVVFATGGWYAWKRSLVRSLIVSLPVLLLYGGVGWFSTSRIFAPVQQVRSMLDPSIDLSTYWREVENFNIATSLKESFLLGQGLGGEYTEAIVNDDISANYPDYRRWPHNTVLGLLILGGAIGFVATWFLRPLTVFLAYGSYRRARNAAERVLAMGCISAIICCLSLEWGDTGLHFTQAKLALALGLALAGNLAVATGAWPNRVARGAPR
ncbi:MAG TPA: hypothetical protein VMK12_21660, partial [Anaeromyxobacteraceae bacterium]|nr:hypothetical protein [Anaeromyxobacteraceae bacterium]